MGEDTVTANANANVVTWKDICDLVRFLVTSVGIGTPQATAVAPALLDNGYTSAFLLSRARESSLRALTSMAVSDALLSWSDDDLPATTTARRPRCSNKLRLFPLVFRRVPTGSSGVPQIIETGLSLTPENYKCSAMSTRSSRMSSKAVPTASGPTPRQL